MFETGIMAGKPLPDNGLVAMNETVSITEVPKPTKVQEFGRT
jgi:hypothetical protein